MQRSVGLLLVLIATLAIIHLVQAQSQRGIISLDCGLPASEVSPYHESYTGLQFSSDATFIQSGETGGIQANRASKSLKPSRTLRYFPEGIRNCYNLNVEKGRNHLLRARFLYGNYDGRNISPKFDLYLGPNLWVTIDLEGEVNGIREEILHIPTSNSLQICLVKTGDTIPMISALEIRPMGNDSYVTESGSLKLYCRYYLSESESYIRYPDDAYDRQWDPYFWKAWTTISTTSHVDTSNNYEPPKDALVTAAIPTNASEPLTIAWTNSDNPDYQYYLCAHFAEIQDLQANDTREFNILFNGRRFYGPLIPDKLKTTTVYSRSLETCNGGKCNFQLTRTTKSTLPPLLNAFEVYTVIQFPQSQTNKKDGNETFEKLGIVGSSSNLVIYLTTVFNMKSITAAKVVNIYGGTSNFGTIVAAFLCDSYFGRYKTLSFAMIACFLYESFVLFDLKGFGGDGSNGVIPQLHPAKCDKEIGSVCNGPSIGQIMFVMGHLSDKGGRSVINWGIRLRIAAEAALGLEYLHIGCTPPMVHRDVKTTNILLDEHYKAKLADFGLSRSFPVGGESHVSTAIAGTPGYLDPEYYQTSRLGEKSDVYSFGIVLLEMITNQPVIDRNRRKSHITQWVGSELNGGDITKIMDPKLNGDYDSRSAWRALELAMSCADPTSAKRPTMSHVVIELKECLVSENSRRNMSRGMDSLSSPEVSMVFESGMIPRAR